MTNKIINLQDSFLNQVRKENVPVVIYLVNGFQLRGSVRGFDNFTVIIENDSKQQLVYKHAISTITPFHGMLPANHDKREEAKPVEPKAVIDKQ
jgi:host factor-I protein